jgi:hypothetical protein
VSSEVAYGAATLAECHLVIGITHTLAAYAFDGLALRLFNRRLLLADGALALNDALVRLGVFAPNGRASLDPALAHRSLLGHLGTDAGLLRFCRRLGRYLVIYVDHQVFRIVLIPARLDRGFGTLNLRQRRPPVQHPQRQRRALVIRQVEQWRLDVPQADARGGGSRRVHSTQLRRFRPPMRTAASGA